MSEHCEETLLLGPTVSNFSKFLVALIAIIHIANTAFPFYRRLGPVSYMLQYVGILFNGSLVAVVSIGYTS